MAPTYNCEPTLIDSQVLEFCKRGYLVLESVVPEETNQKTLDYLGSREHETEPTDILKEKWFLDDVVKNPSAAGAVRSLLGRDFGLPVIMSNHRAVCPQPAQEWHVDGNSHFGPDLQYLQVFYYPQECPRDMGPTEVMPGSHHFYSLQSHMGQYGRIQGSEHVVAPAGTIFLTVYSIWHRRGDSTGRGVRYNLKYNYWRTTPPRRDWIVEPDFDVATANYSSQLPIYLSDTPSAYVRSSNAEMFCWLSGNSDLFEVAGGQGWPKGDSNFTGRPYGVPKGL